MRKGTLLEATAAGILAVEWNNGWSSTLHAEMDKALNVMNELVYWSHFNLADEIIGYWGENPLTLVDQSYYEDILYCIHLWGKRKR